MWYRSVHNLLGQSRLRQTAIVNMYHVTKVSLNLSFTVHFNCTKISRFTPFLYRRIVWAGFYMLIFYLRISQFAVCRKRDSKVFTNETFHQDKRNKKCRTPLPSFPRFPPLPHRPRVGAAETKKNYPHRRLAPFNQSLHSAIYWINHYPGGLINSKIKRLSNITNIFK